MTVNIYVCGDFYITFSHVREFDNGGGLITYSAYHVKENGAKASYILKEFYKAGMMPAIKQNCTNWIIDGSLQRDVYQDKLTGEWIDKGIYIEVNTIECHIVGDISDIIEKRGS